MLSYLSKDTKKFDREIEDTSIKISKNISIISSISTTSHVHDMLEYFMYSKVEMIELLKHKPTKENVEKLFEYTEVILEGADNIVSKYSFYLSKNDKKTLEYIKLRFNLELLKKYYFARHIGLDFDDFVSLEKNNTKSILEFISNISNIEMSKELSDLISIVQDEEIFVPFIIYEAIEYIDYNIEKKFFNNK